VDQLGPQHLKSDTRAQFAIERFIDFAHPACPQRPDDLKPPAETVARRKHESIGMERIRAGGEQTARSVVLCEQSPHLNSKKDIVAAGRLQVDFALGGLEFYSVLKILSDPLPLNKRLSRASFHS
jgi:hypothetical protein